VQSEATTYNQKRKGKKERAKEKAKKKGALAWEQEPPKDAFRFPVFF
jgi:hypothetical protein